MLSVGVGVVLAIVIDQLTEYFTDTHFKPVKDIAKATSGGPATTILSGIAIGKESAVWATLVIAGDDLGRDFDLGGSSANLAEQGVYVLYGVAMTGIGMLTLTGNNVAMDSFGPISDNANGIGEMAGVTDGNARQTWPIWTRSATPPRPSPRASRSAQRRDCRGVAVRLVYHRCLQN